MYIATQLYSCPYCYSQNLVWDYSAGVVVCSSCGSVIDAIYDSSPSFTEVRSRVESVKYFPKSLREIEKNRRKVELAERRARSIKVVKSLPESVKKICKYGMEIAYKVSPSLVEGKGLRSRYAVGYMLYTLLTGRHVDVEKVSKMFGVSISTARRLAKNVAHRIGLIKQQMC